MDDEVTVIFYPLGLRTIPFPSRIYKDFLYTSLMNTTFMSRQTPESMEGVSGLVSLPERSTQIDHLLSIFDFETASS